MRAWGVEDVTKKRWMAKEERFVQKSMNKIIQKNEGFEDARNCKKTAQQRNSQLEGAGKREREGGKEGWQGELMLGAEKEEGD